MNKKKARNELEKLNFFASNIDVMLKEASIARNGIGSVEIKIDALSENLLFSSKYADSSDDYFKLIKLSNEAISNISDIKIVLSRIYEKILDNIITVSKESGLSIEKVVAEEEPMRGPSKIEVAEEEKANLSSENQQLLNALFYIDENIRSGIDDIKGEKNGKKEDEEEKACDSKDQRQDSDE